MNARLGFSCAIHVEADLIIIDETLAVGDVGFRVKCYSKIKAMQAQGQTFLIVSHSPNLIANFCTRVILLEKGVKVFDGPPLDGLEAYKDIREELDRHQRGAAQSSFAEKEADHPLWLDGFQMERVPGPGGVDRCVINATLHCRKHCHHPFVSFGLRNQEGIVICSYDSTGSLPQMGVGSSIEVSMSFDNRLLQGTYFLSAKTGEIVGDVVVTSSTHHNVSRLDVVGEAVTKGLVDLKLKLDFQKQLIAEIQS
jgi:hypothetical protein